jgi:hypothetical protein
MQNINFSRLKQGLLMVTFFTALVGTVSTAVAQLVTGSISGTVTDSKGAVIQKATVTLSTSESARGRVLKTNSDGFFNASDLLPGAYTITIESAGFQTLTEPDVVVTSQKEVSLGKLQMAVGAVTETTTVTADISGIDRESANVQSTLSTNELDKIESKSYDIMEALTLLPGTVDSNSGNDDSPSMTSGSNTNINGLRTNSKNVMIDGVASNDPGPGSMVNTLPSIGMVAELKLMSTNYRADSGRNSGPSVIIITKNGSPEIHGSFNIPLRNEFFDANNPDQKRQGLTRAPYRLFIPDYTLTGPLLIPHLIGRNRHMFFQLSQQFQLQVKDSTPSTKLSTVPTLLERQGNFTQSKYYTTTATATGGNTQTSTVVTIPAAYATGNIITNIDPIGQALLNYYPLPNAAQTDTNGTSWNYQSTTESTLNRQSQMLRIDWQPSDNIQMYARFQYVPELDKAAWNPGSGQSAIAGGFSNIGWNAGIFQENNIGTGFLYSITQTLSSTLVNSFSFSTSTTNQTGGAVNPSLFTAAGTGINLPSMIAGANAAGYLPNIGFGCQNTPNTSSCPSSHYQSESLGSITMDTSFPNHQHLHSFQITDNITKVWKTHSFAAGVYWEAVRRNYAANGINTTGTNERGSYSFYPGDSANPCDTSSPWANILTGCIDSYNQNSARAEALLRFKNVEAYAQDEWRANYRLTISYGVRAYHDAPAHDALNQMWTFIPSQYNPSLAPRLWLPQKGTPSAVTSTLCSAPTTGATTYSVDPLTGAEVSYACRGLYVSGSSPLANPATNGMVQAGTNGLPRSIYSTKLISLAPRFGFNYALTTDGKTVVKGGAGLYYDRFPLQNQLNMIANPPVNTQVALNSVTGYSSIASLAAQMAPPNMIALPLGTYVPPSTLSYSVELQRQVSRDGLVGLAYVGNRTQHQIAEQQINAQPLYSQLYYLHPENIDPSQSLTGCSSHPCMLPSTFLNPYRGFSSIKQQVMSTSSNYNSLQLSVADKLFHRHLQLRGNWTYSKALGTAYLDTYTMHTYQSPAEPISDYSPLSFDRRHIVNVFYILDLPDPGKALNSRFVSLTTRGWSISGVARYSTGAPWTPSLDLSGVPGVGGNGLIGTSGTDVTGSADQARPIRVSRNAKITPGDSVGKFTGPTLGTWGNMGQNSLNWPSWTQFDATVYRTFHPSKKLSVIFRTEIYNIPNSTVVMSLNNVLQYNYNSTQVPQPSTSATTLGLMQINTAFDTAASGGGLNGNLTNFFRQGRVIQFDIGGRW